MYPKTIKQLFSLFLALVLCFGSLTVGVSAAGTGPAVSSNIDDHFYINAQRWAAPINSTLSAEGEGFERVEHINGTLVVEQYDANLKYISGKTLELELPIYGGVYMCDDYNFVVVGKNNYEQDDTVEVFRIIRYSKDWVRQASCGLYGANTIEPFQAGSVRFDRCGDYLYIRTAHKMYASANDGLNHQANVMINVRVSDMTVADSFTDVLNKNYGYISHSFNQFVRVDGTDLLAVDHGDALPRSVVLIKYNNPAGQDNFYGRVSYVNALPIIDSTYHYNDTGVSVGGFEFSSTDYLIAGCAYDQTVAADLMLVHRNIFVTATPKDNFTDAGTTIHWLTDYTANDNVVVSPPHMVKIEQDRFFLVWTEDDVLKYCFINGRGELEGQIITGQGDLSDCVPILADGRIIWYVTNNSAPVFHEVSTKAPHVHEYTAAVTAPTCTEAGYTTYTCHCGESYVADEVPALGHSWDDGVVTLEPTEEEEGVKTYTCLVCGAAEEESIPKLPHTHKYSAVVTKPTCTEDGYTTYTCRCGDRYVADEVPATGHSWDEGTVTKKATEEEEGVKTYTCLSCGATEEESIPKLPHTHEYSAVVTKPTCTKDGYTTYTCRCGDRYVADEVPALGHSWDQGTVTREPTEYETGLKVYACMACGAVKEETIPELGHTHQYTAVVTKPTCTTDGYTTHTCRCGDSYITDVIPATGHRWNSGVVTKEPTEEEAGVKTYTCTACGETKTETIPKLAHTHSYTAEITDPTCTQSGYTTYTCRCGDSYRSDVIPATGHRWNSGVVTKEPTEKEAGIKTYTCTACGETKTETIPKLAHTHSYTAVITKPTCTEGGYTTYTCRCGDSYVADHTAASGHDYDNGTCAACGDVCIAAPVAKSSNKASTGKPMVTWAPVENAVKYEVYRATSKTGTYSRKLTTTNTAYVNTGATAGKYYYYFVRAYDADGNYADSKLVGRTCDLAQTTVKLSNVASTGKIRISWEPVEGATKYQVWRATSKNGTYTRLITTTATSVVNNKTEAGKTYYYKVRAVCDVSAAAGAYSALKSRTCDLPQPDVSITRSSGKPKVSWDKVDGAVSYKVYRTTSKTGTYSLVKTSTGSYYKDTKAVSGKTYYYKVVAVCSNTAGNSAYSAVVSIKATK